MKGLTQLLRLFSTLWRLFSTLRDPAANFRPFPPRPRRPQTAAPAHPSPQGFAYSEPLCLTSATLELG